VEACLSFRNFSTSARNWGGSALTVTTSNARPRYMRLMFTSSGNSTTHGPHQVAQALISRSFVDSFLARAARPFASIGDTVTSSSAHFLTPSASQPFFSAHLIEQPKTLVFSMGTARPSRRASIALRVSWTLIFSGFSASSTRPTNLSLRA